MARMEFDECCGLLELQRANWRELFLLPWCSSIVCIHKHTCGTHMCVKVRAGTATKLSPKFTHGRAGASYCSRVGYSITGLPRGP